MFPTLRRLAGFVGQGLLAVLPLLLTISILAWLAAKAEGLFSVPIKYFLEERYVRGMGIVFGLVVTAFVGAAVNFYIGEKLLALGNYIIEKIPLAKTLFGAIKDMLSLFGGQKKSFNSVVLLTLPGSSQKILGLVTREGFPDMQGFPDDAIAVYVPMSYQLGGFTYIVPRDNVEPVAMSVEEALRFAVTAGITASPHAPVAAVDTDKEK